MNINRYICLFLFRYKQSNGWQLFTGENLLKAHPVRNIIPYPQVKYNQFLYNNDIALVELEEPLIFSRNVSAICLPKHPIQVCILRKYLISRMFRDISEEMFKICVCLSFSNSSRDKYAWWLDGDFLWTVRSICRSISTSCHCQRMISKNAMRPLTMQGSLRKTTYALDSLIRIKDLAT